MRAVVTGAGGFIGSHVVERLLERGWEVTALVRYNSQGSWGHLESSPVRDSSKLKITLGDVTDGGQMQTVIEEGDIVLHLAALIGIAYSYHAPASYVLTNVTGTLNILDASKRSGAARVVVTSTSEVYGTAQYTPMDEDHPLQGQSPYSASKIGADKLAESYYRSFDLPVVTLRPFNTYGPRQSARAIIPTVLSQALSDASEIRLGNLAPQRDLTFVGDTARAFALAAEMPGIEGETIHFGQGEAISIGELAQKCIEVTGSQARIVSEAARIRPARSEVEVLLCNAAKANRLLGWTPQVSLEEGLQRCAEYIRSNIKEYKPRSYNL
jgi:NAD dependent epimerase/dehydratase